MSPTEMSAPPHRNIPVSVTGDRLGAEQVERARLPMHIREVFP
jgi:hypothetical protein